MRYSFAWLLGMLLVAGCRSPELTPLPPVLLRGENAPVFCTLLPNVSFDNVTLTEAVKRLKAIWQEQAPGRRIPPIILVNVEPEAKVTLEFKKPAPAYECLRYMALAAGVYCRIQGDTVMLGTRIGDSLTSDEVTCFVPVSKKGQEFLGLSPTTSRQDLGTRLAALGITFWTDPPLVWWYADGEYILIHNYPDPIHKLYGILALIDEGYEIRKGAK